MTDPRFDFRALDPARDDEHDARIARIVASAMAARRSDGDVARSPGVLDLLARWTAPALAAAAAIALLSLPALARLERPAAAATPAPSPSPYERVASWVHSNHEPSPIELFTVLEAPAPPAGRP